MSKSNLPSVNRRALFAGASAVGALAAVAGVSRVVQGQPAPAPSVATVSPEPLQSGGYQLTDHVKQYYATARV